MKTLTALALLALTQPAEACHRFSVWRYPYPQRCGVARVERVVAIPAAIMPPMRPVEFDPATEMLRERLASPPHVEPGDLLLSRARELHL